MEVVMEQNMNQLTDLQQQLIIKCSLVFHSYFDRDMDQFVKLLDENFVWIGSYDFQFTRGIEEFLKITEDEQNEVQAQVYDEEYHILSHAQNTWIVYGSFSASAWKDEETFLYTHQRATYVWNLTEDGFKLLHLHCTMSRDIPLEGQPMEGKINKGEKTALDSSWFDYMLRADAKRNQKQERILLKDSSGEIHYLLPAEILYISISYKIATVHTSSGTFCIHRSLNQLLTFMPFLIQIHKSWLVNPIYVQQIRRYTITLSNKEELPIGKSRYTEIREVLKTK